MLTFLKANVSSLIASGTDYLITVLLVELLGIEKVLASMCGNICGGVVNFFIGRKWAFKAEQKKISAQAFRYLAVWLGSLALNAGGMHLMVHVAGVHYTVSKVIVSLIVAFAYNYPLQKRFVFSNN